MSANARLLVHAGGVRRSREQLATLPTPIGTSTWKPVPHFSLVNELIAGLESRGITVARDEYATLGRGDAKLFGVMRLAVPGLDTDEYRMALGLRAGNDRSMSIQIVSGVNVFVCDNLMIKGDGAIVLRKRHTSGLDLASVLPNAIDAFLSKAEGIGEDIERMKGFALSDERAKGLLHDAFSGSCPVLPLRLFPVVSRLYSADDEQRAKFPSRDLWSWNNALTEAVKALKPAPQHHCGIRIGKFCGWLIHRGRPELN